MIAYYCLILLIVTLGATTGNPSAVSAGALSIGILAILFQRFIHRDAIVELGFRLCSGSDIAAAITLPIAITSLVFAIDYVFGFIDIEPLHMVPNPANQDEIGITVPVIGGILLLSGLTTIVGSLFTEELAFRGYLIGRLRRAGTLKALFISSVCFGVWHLPASLFVLHPGQHVISLIYVVNISLFGLLLGSLYIRSGSLLPPSIIHGVWNALDYTLFGFGTTRGVFPGQSRIIFDPDEGLVGTAVLFLIACSILWSQFSNKAILNRNNRQ